MSGPRDGETRNTPSGFPKKQKGHSLFLRPVKSEKLTPGSALQKLMVYCRYQERCHSEVREKLASYGVFGKDADAITARLIEENFLNEERFAIQFAGGKFRIKKWGREKIEHALRTKGISAWCIKRALREIGDEDYGQTFEKLAVQHWKRLSATCTGAARKQKIYTALRSRGYDSVRIGRYVDELEKAEKRKRTGKKKS